MIHDRRVLAIVPARGGSKGLPRKNILPMAGKPLIAWTLDAARGSAHIDTIAVSTEDEEIHRIVTELGFAPSFVRPAELAADDTLGIKAVFHAIEQLPGHDIVVVLQPTSPLRTSADIDTALSCMLEQQAPACVSVTTPDKSPFWMYSINEQGYMRPLIDSDNNRKRRQDLPPIQVLNGAVYIAEREWLLKQGTFVTTETIAYAMPKGRSQDIDDEIDFMVAEQLLSRDVP